MDFLVGCNYWASHAGTEMWYDWDEDAVREDVKLLSENGVRCLRVFPNWRDFQPIMPVYASHGRLIEYRLERDRMPENEYYIEEVMLKRFSTFCEVCEEYGMKLIVALVTGWMSGRLLIPAAMAGKNLYTDPTALFFEEKYIKGLVKNLKHHSSILAWELGNECNCMSPCISQYEAASWTAFIVNAIRANDPDRMVISGMHGISADKDGDCWTIKDQGQNCDMVTTHPYAIFVKHVYKDGTDSFRTAMHATCETKYYADLGGKPGLIEEIGTVGPAFGDDETTAGLLRVGMLSGLANGARGALWWCAFDQMDLDFPPYTQNMCEVELGMIDRNKSPKPVIREMQRIGEMIEQLPFELPPAKEDAVCILTQFQEQWGVAFMAYCMAKQAGLNLRFAYCKDPIPEAGIYMVPSTCGTNIMPRETYLELRRRVQEGAVLYISNDDGTWAELDQVSGMRIRDSKSMNESLTVTWEGDTVPFSRAVRYETYSVGAKVLATDSAGIPAISRNAYGKGTVYYVNFPLESMLLDKNFAFDGNAYTIYRKLFKEAIEAQKIRSDNPFVGVTLHPDQAGGAYCVAVNYSSEKQSTELVIQPDAQVEEVYYGDLQELESYEAAIFHVTVC